VLPSGIGLAAAYAAELGDAPEPADPAAPPEMLTMFIEVAPGNFITFFDAPHTLSEEKFRVCDGVEDYHLAFEVGSRDELLRAKKRLEDHGVAVSEPVDLQANESIYFYDPNGVHLEITIRTEPHDMILEGAKRAAPASLQAWMEKTAALRAARLAGGESTRRAHEELKRRVVQRITESVAAGAPGTEI
jgi:catechol 2,3-dioxygenase-like lactoylglutathione lyase family enzyme